MNSFLEKHTTRRNILILLGLVVIIEILFGVLLPKGENAVMIDMAGSTNAGQIYEIIGNYDEGMRQSYGIMALTLDLAFPLAYFLFFALLLFKYWKKLWLGLLPLFQAICDICENTGIVIMLRSWPDRLDGMANAVVVFSWLKWGFAAITVVLILIGIMKTIRVKSRIRRSS